MLLKLQKNINNNMFCDNSIKIKCYFKQNGNITLIRILKYIHFFLVNHYV